MNNLPIYIYYSLLSFFLFWPVTFFFFNGKRYNSLRGSASLFNYNKCMVIICPQLTLADFHRMHRAAHSRKTPKNTRLCFKYLLKTTRQNLVLIYRRLRACKESKWLLTTAQFHHRCAQFLSIPQMSWPIAMLTLFHTKNAHDKSSYY